MRIDRRLLGWGAFFVIAGAIPLAVRANLITRDSVADWPSLWPLLLVGAGLGLLLRRTPAHLLGGTISVLTAGVMLGGLLAAGFNGFPAFGACGSNGSGSPFADRAGSFADRGSVRVEFSCGKVDIGAADGSGWALSGSGPSSRLPVVETSADNVRIASPEGTFFGFNEPSSSWKVTVPRAPVVSVSLTLNAGEGTVNLAGASVDAFNLTLNAGSISADLATTTATDTVNSTVNAGSATLSLPGGVNTVNATVNAGSMKVCVPAGSGLRVSWGGALADNNFDSQGLVRVDDNHWQSSGLSATSHAIDINASANAGSFTLLIGGNCNA
jgi:hypothetical protein